MNKNRRIRLLALVGLSLASHHASAQSSAKPASTPAAPPGRQTYDSFRLVHTRNVFDPDRRPVRPRGESTPPPVAARADYVALTGTMINNDKSYAFFSGSRSEFNKVLGVSDKIANATLTQITPLNIEIEREGKRTLVAVGQTVPLDGKSAPGAPPADDVPPPPAPAPAAGSDAPADPGVAAAAAAAPGAAPRVVPGTTVPLPGGPPSAAKLEEIRQRMMKSRQQDLK